MYNVAILGANGFVGAELMRLVLAHPQLQLVVASSDSDAGKAVSAVYPSFLGQTELSFVKHEAVLKHYKEDIDLAFLPVPHTAAMALAPSLLSEGIPVIDLSADFRLHEAATYEQWYGVKHTSPELLSEAVYGMPEMFRKELASLAEKIKDKKPVLVANPGCYPTASTLAVLPALKANCITQEDVIVINAISGVSGAGKKANDVTQFCLANESVNAYGAATHRHTPEIAQNLSTLAGYRVQVQFTPHLAPLNRGMVSTVTLHLNKEAAKTADPQNIQLLYEEAYAAEPFVQVLPYGQMPKSSSVRYSNNAQVGVAYDESTHMIIASCAIDNLGKGAAAQAVQCANILLSLEETTGLKFQGGFL